MHTAVYNWGELWAFK